ncbi:MAG: hypothetical protein QNJ37_11995 [Crocosphaera sp.]|nr:hypothetical protein [Crocosphaera sp.]
MINPIETVYKGIRFRSRLEARWAVFLDTLNFKFVYEPDGYDLNGTWYLPDFWVPDWKAFLEIKPQQPTKEQMDKCQSLSTLTSYRVLLIAGQPWIDEYTVFLFEPELSNQLEDEDNEEKNDEDHAPDFTWTPLGFAQDRKDERVIWLCSEDEYGCEGTSLYFPPEPHPRWGEKNPLTGEWANRIIKAFEAARQERFNT